MKKILIFGDSKIKKNITIKNLLKEYSGTLVKISKSSKDPLEELNNNIMSNSLFGDKKNILIDELNKFSDKIKDTIINQIKELESEDIELFIISNDSKLKIKFDQTFDCSLPKHWEVDKWINFIKDIASFFNTTIKDDAAEYLLNLYGYNDVYLFEELKKLSIYSDETITTEDIKEIGYLYSNIDFENFSYLLSSKRKEEVLELAKKYLSNPDFYITPFISYLFRYFLDLYRVIINIEPKKKFSWPEAQKISQDTDVSKMRVKKFLGIRFKNEKEFYANHTLFYTKKDLMDIIIKLEEYDRLAKIGENKDLIFMNIIFDICG
ncbi:DNA polymerase III subunit delta [Marinitoga litoralis]|uniref:DNA polymerase III subunit delta n=1 Tax=Marinitoga litoralis TaxID=570855 RepID=UPI0019607446|nr:hypothetical protein [Marinitoga litoralis]MBM7560035.1 DNA polymerase-3 subunit delta [Marinitoga litoralis]